LATGTKHWNWNWNSTAKHSEASRLHRIAAVTGTGTGTGSGTGFGTGFGTGTEFGTGTQSYHSEAIRLQ